MSNILKITVDLPKLDLRTANTVSSTDWVITNYPNFQNPSYTVFTSLKDTTNISTLRYSVPDTTKPYYARYRFHISSPSTSDVAITEWSKIIILRPDQTHIIPETSALVQTPSISTSVSGTNLIITTTPIIMYYGSDTHTKTSWYIKTPTDETVYSEVNSTKLTSITLPLSILRHDTAYLIQAVQHTKQGLSSLAGEIIYENKISLIETFDIKSVNYVYFNYDNFISFLKKPINYLNCDVIVLDETETIVSSNLAQTNLVPSYNTFTLNLHTIYTVKIRIKLTTGEYSGYKTVWVGRLSNIVKRNIDQYIKYLDKFNNTDTIDLKGQTVQSATESINGDILLTKQFDNKLYRYKHYKGKLSYIDTLLTINNINPKKLKQYVNTIILPNNDLLIDYEMIREIHTGSPLYTTSMNDDSNIVVVSDGADIVKYRPMFEYYSYNIETHKYSMINHIIRDDEMHGTADTNAINIVGTDIYYIPAKQITSLSDETSVEVKLRKLDLKTMTVTDISALPVTGIYSYANLNYIKDDTLLFTNGSGLVYNVNDKNLNTVINQYDRVNNDIYEYKISTNVFTKIGTMPSTVNLNNYLYQTYLRKDGKIVMFNSVYSGPEVGIQNTILFNPVDNTCVENTNDTPDNLIFRNTIVLQDGDFLRISNLATGTQTVDTYVSDTYKTNQIVNNVVKTLITDLVVKPGESVAIDYPYRYTTITIQGTSSSDTGVLNWIDGDVVRAYHWNDLLMPGPRTIAGTDVWNSITFLPGGKLTIT